MFTREEQPQRTQIETKNNCYSFVEEKWRNYVEVAIIIMYNKLC